MQHLASVSQYVFLLVLYNLIIMRKWYKNPFKMCTSEIASTWFPFIRYSKGRILLKDDIYYPYPACLPFLSSFYPINMLVGWLCQFFDMDRAFKIYAVNILLHFMLGSLLAFYSLRHFGYDIALFGAISLTYSAYFLKTFMPEGVYTHTWILGAIGGGWFGAFSLGMAILGGYWPTLVYIFPVLVIWHPEIILGVLIGLPQIIPTLWYWPKSIRHHQTFDPNWGKVPWWRYVDLILPDTYHNSIRGVFWPEMSMYMGLAIALVPFAGWSWWWVPLLLSFFVRIQRIRARSLYLFSFSAIMLALSGINPSLAFMLALLQGFLLLTNVDIYPHFPICQWWKKPSEFFGKYVNSTDWPYFTGYIFSKHHMWYNGGFRLVKQPD